MFNEVAIMVEKVEDGYICTDITFDTPTAQNHLQLNYGHAVAMDDATLISNHAALIRSKTFSAPTQENEKKLFHLLIGNMDELTLVCPASRGLTDPYQVNLEKRVADDENELKLDINAMVAEKVAAFYP